MKPLFQSRRSFQGFSNSKYCNLSFFFCSAVGLILWFAHFSNFSCDHALFSKFGASFPFIRNSLELVRESQKGFCQTLVHLLDDPPLRTKVTFGANSSLTLSRIDDIHFRLGNHSVAGVGANLLYNIYVVDDDGRIQDTVSQFIFKEKEWESYAVMSLMEQMEKHRLERGLNRSDVYFIDIGANIGTFTIPIARAGFSVLAFEGFAVNQQALRLSICANKGLTDRVTLFPVALGKESAMCALYSPDGNILNGNVACDENPPGLVWRQDVTISRLDDVLGMGTIKELEGRVAGLKLDAEGHEPWILAGGQEFMSITKPPYMYTEVNNYALETNAGSSGQDYLRQLAALHYSASETFGGPYLSEKDMEEKGYIKDSNLFFTYV